MFLTRRLRGVRGSVRAVLGWVGRCGPLCAQWYVLGATGPIWLSIGLLRVLGTWVDLAPGAAAADNEAGCRNAGRPAGRASECVASRGGCARGRLGPAPPLILFGGRALFLAAPSAFVRAWTHFPSRPGSPRLDGGGRGANYTGTVYYFFLFFGGGGELPVSAHAPSLSVAPSSSWTC